MCGQLAISQATTDGAERVLALGRLSMSYTIGSVLGPALGDAISIRIPNLIALVILMYFFTII